MSDMVNALIFILLVFILFALFDGDPDLWDKLLEITHHWADEQLVGGTQ